MDMKRPFLPSMAKIAVVHSCYRQDGCVPELSDCIQPSWGETGLKDDRNKISHRPGLRQRVFGVGLERQSQ